MSIILGVVLLLGNFPPDRMLPNPAAQFCVQAGGRELAIRSAAGESALCIFDAGSIEAWTLFRHANGVQTTAVQRYFAHPDPQPAGNAQALFAYCTQQGGMVAEYTDKTGAAVPLCRFDDNSAMPLQTLLEGPTAAGHERLDALLEADTGAEI